MNQLDLAVNHAMAQSQIALARMRLINPSAGLDAKRSQAWCEYGFKEVLEFQDFYNLYRRGGIGHGAVNKLVNNCWKSSPWIIEGDEQDNARNVTQWEESLKKDLQLARFWRWFAEADKRRLIGRYSALILQINDGSKWSEEVKKGKALVRLIPAWANCIVPTAFDDDEKSEKYGQPTMWQYTETLRDGKQNQVKIHPDRVFILGDWTDNAIGYLEAAFNALVSLEKVEGGSGESFLKNAARQMHLNFSKDVNLQAIAAMYDVSIDELQQKYNEAARDLNRANDMLMITQGATVSPLVSTVPDPTATYNVNLQTTATAFDIPVKILVGMQTGERASTEDQKYFNARCQSRRVNELSFEINDLLQKLMDLQIIKPEPEFTVMWDDLTEATQSERLANAKTLSEINNTALATGIEAFSINEIREAAGYDPQDDPDPLDDDGPEEEDGESTDSTEQQE